MISPAETIREQAARLDTQTAELAARCSRIENALARLEAALASHVQNVESMLTQHGAALRSSMADLAGEARRTVTEASRALEHRRGPQTIPAKMGT